MPSRAELLPLMVQQGLDKQDVKPYFDRYMELFGDTGSFGKGEHAGDVESLRGKLEGN